MSAKFLESVSGKLAERWVASLITPAFIFWSGGAIAAVDHFTWPTLHFFLTKQLEEPFRTVFLIALFCGVVVSGLVVQRFDLGVLRFLEGYWLPWLPLKRIRRWLIRKEQMRSDHIRQRWQELNLLSDNQLQDEEHDELVRLDWQQQHFPLEHQIMPTRLGNLLRSAESYPSERYGIDAIVCWPRLWLVLPETTKKDLQSARADLDSSARTWLWCLMFMVWGIWVRWLAPLGFISAVFTYYCWATSAASNYGELIRATFDLYRHLLYESLRWHLPANPDEERRVGKELTEYLWRGF
jgi:hypothetical protein